jgi:hypothetical protein
MLSCHCYDSLYVFKKKKEVVINSVQNTDLEPPIYRLQETSKTVEIQTLFVERSDES